LLYAAYAPFIRHWDINRLPYDGEADRWFDPAWLVAGDHRVSAALQVAWRCRRFLLQASETTLACLTKAKGDQS
jgi:hypothetical protein